MNPEKQAVILEEEYEVRDAYLRFSVMKTAEPVLGVHMVCNQGVCASLLLSFKSMYVKMKTLKCLKLF